ncbi:chitinase-3-like protein 2 [Pyrus ussuriensis x Pyrus communis]|uniref:Chitinase-3-like protein 2 n=1 Tax=Pyrus ussuriensis x Pyrus communis TaxID=2448454 RepID=A0A5N5G6E4_9ROSA|nr:chitinase-3-like protein 2 [Pyrus ussuriensis x Pyrus communis]
MPFFILVIFHTVLSSGSGSSSDHFYPSGKGIRAAYFPSPSSFSPSSIDTQCFTHIYYAFLQPEPSTYKLYVTQFDQARIPEFIKALRTKNPPVTTLLSIGGGDNNAQFRWLGNRGSRALELSGKPRLLLTSAVYYASKFPFYGGPRSYPAGAISKYWDWASPMCYDYHGSWENFTGMKAALDDSNSNISTRYGIRLWIEAGGFGFSLRQLVGILLISVSGPWCPTQKSHRGSAKVNGIGAPALGVGPRYGVLVYHQIVHFNKRTNATVVFDAESASYYSYSGRSWIGYDGVQSVDVKVRFAKLLGLGGYFFWALACNAWKY